MVINPLPGKIYVKLDEKVDKFGNVVIATDAAQKTRIGTVLAVGDKCDLISKGDRVALPFYAGVYIHIPGLGYLDEKHKIMGEKEVMFWVGEEE